jgi:hypothetical protein
MALTVAVLTRQFQVAPPLITGVQFNNNYPIHEVWQHRSFQHNHWKVKHPSQDMVANISRSIRAISLTYR